MVDGRRRDGELHFRFDARRGRGTFVGHALQFREALHGNRRQCGNAQDVLVPREIIGYVDALVGRKGRRAQVERHCEAVDDRQAFDRWEVP